MNNFQPEHSPSNNQITDVIPKNEGVVINVLGEVLKPDGVVLETQDEISTETSSVVIVTEENSELLEQTSNNVDSVEQQANRLTFNYEFSPKQEVTNIQEYLHNVWVSYIPSLYQQINAGITSDTAKDTLWKVLNSKFFQIDNNPTFIQNPNIVISSQKGEEPSPDDEAPGLFCSLVITYKFKGTVEQLPFMNLVNIIDSSENVRCITSINPSSEKDEIILETLIEEKNLYKFLESITERIQEENKKIQTAYSQFFNEHTEIIESEYAKNKKIKSFFSGKKPQAF